MLTIFWRKKHKSTELNSISAAMNRNSPFARRSGRSPKHQTGGSHQKGGGGSGRGGGGNGRTRYGTHETDKTCFFQLYKIVNPVAGNSIIACRVIAAGNPEYLHWSDKILGDMVKRKAGYCKANGDAYDFIELFFGGNSEIVNMHNERNEPCVSVQGLVFRVYYRYIDLLEVTDEMIVMEAESFVRVFNLKSRLPGYNKMKLAEPLISNAFTAWNQFAGTFLAMHICCDDNNEPDPRVIFEKHPELAVAYFAEGSLDHEAIERTGLDRNHFLRADLIKADAAAAAAVAGTDTGNDGADNGNDGAVTGTAAGNDGSTVGASSGTAGNGTAEEAGGTTNDDDQTDGEEN